MTFGKRLRSRLAVACAGLMFASTLLTPIASAVTTTTTSPTEDVGTSKEAVTEPIRGDTDKPATDSKDKAAAETKEEVKEDAVATDPDKEGTMGAVLDQNTFKMSRKELSAKLGYPVYAQSDTKSWAASSKGLADFSPYDTGDTSQWLKNRGYVFKYPAEGGNNISYNVYTEAKQSKEGLKIINEQFGDQPRQDFFTFTGFAIQQGYNNHYANTSRTYLVLSNADTGERKYFATDVLEKTTATTDFTYNRLVGNVPRGCTDNEFNKYVEDCTMKYEGVGFRAYIPLDDLFGEVKPEDGEQSWKVSLVHSIKGQKGARAPHFVWTPMVVPIAAIDLGEYENEYSSGTLDFASGYDKIVQTTYVDDHVRRDSPNGRGLSPLGSATRYFKQSTQYPVLGSDQNGTVVWYKYGKKGKEAQDSWGNSQYFSTDGQQAMLTYKPNMVKLTTTYTDTPASGDNKLLLSVDEKITKDKKITRSVPYNLKGGKTESAYYADVYSLKNKKIYYYKIKGSNYVFYSQEQNHTIKADKDTKINFNMRLDRNYNASKPSKDTDVNTGGGGDTGTTPNIRYYDKPVKIEHIDRKTGTVIDTQQSKVIPLGTVIYKPAPNGTYMNGEGKSYVGVPENKDVTVTNPYLHPGQVEPPAETVIKFYYDVSNTDYVGSGDNAIFNWNLFKTSTKSKSQIQLRNIIDTGDASNAYYAYRDAVKSITIVGGEEYEQQTPYHKEYLGGVSAGQISRDFRKTYNDPNYLKGKQVNYKFKLQVTNTSYDYYECSGYSKDDDGNYYCSSWRYVETIPVWGDGSEKYPIPAYIVPDVKTITYSATLSVDHDYGSKQALTSNQTMKISVGKQETVSPTGNRDRVDAYETLVADKLLYNSDNPVRNLLTQSNIPLNGGFTYRTNLIDMQIGGNGGLYDEVSYDRDLIYVNDGGNRTASADDDVDGKGNNGGSAYYVQDVDANLKDTLHVNKVAGTPEFDENNSLGVYKLPVGIDKLGGGKFQVNTLSDYRVTKNTGFQVQSKKGANSSEVNAQAQAEYNQFTGVDPKDSDIVLDADQQGSKYYLPIAADSANQDNPSLPTNNLKPDTKYTNTMVLGSLGLNDVELKMKDEFKFDKYLVGSVLEFDDAGNSNTLINQQHEAISKDVEYTNTIKVDLDSMDGVRSDLSTEDGYKINTFREANDKGLWDVIKNYLK